ncbi:MarR family transcriptional regulator [Caulobacter sp. 17J80-11]|nr:MarR family transcriptional regulator [Caulobacter sp. 17J80-11]
MRTAPAVLERVQADLKAQGLPPLDWYDVLLELDREPDGRLRQTDLGKRLLLARYNLTRLLDRLEAAGLVRREPWPDDARSSAIVLTDPGREARRQVWPVYAAAVHSHVGDRLDKTELETLATLLGKLS